MRLSFRFRWIPFLAAMLVMALGISLGNWQAGRAAQKLAIEQSFTDLGSLPLLELNQAQAGSVQQYRRVGLKGEFLTEWPVYLENRPYQGKAGFYLLMPIRMENSDRVYLVARGWFARNLAERTRLPQIPHPSGQVRIEGVARSSAGHVMQLGDAPVIQPGAILQNLEIADFALASKLPVQTFIIEQSSDTQDGLVRDWPQASAGVDKHRGYAFQWYALAATAFVFFLVTGFRRGSKTSTGE